MSYIVLKGGERHYFGEPFTPNIETIAYALSNINRYTGHVGPYSVAQHSVLVAEQLSEHFNLKLSGLLHDTTEAYIGDVSSPLKRLLPDYKKIENHYHDVIDKHWNVNTRSLTIRTVDMKMLITEAQQFGIWQDDGSWPKYKPFDLHIEPWSANVAECKFLDMFERLTK